MDCLEGGGEFGDRKEWNKRKERNLRGESCVIFNKNGNFVFLFVRVLSGVTEWCGVVG